MKSSRFSYKAFTLDMVSEKYLAWLNDEETNRYSRRRGVHSTKEDAIQFIKSVGKDEYLLAICSQNGDHIGNIHLGPIDLQNQNAEIRILIGDKDWWNKGVASEAIYTCTKFLFFEKNVHRIGADTCNPAFSSVMRKLGWRLEGVMKERMLIENEWFDFSIYGILKNEFKELPELE